MVVLSINAICAEHEVTDGATTLACDIIEALHRVTNLDYCISLNHTLFYLTTVIQYHIKQSRIIWSTNSFTKVDQRAKWNVKMDYLARNTCG